MYIIFNQNVTGNRSFDVAPCLCLLTSNDERVGQEQQSDDGTDPACIRSAHTNDSRIDVSSRPSSQCVASVAVGESVGSSSSACGTGESIASQLVAVAVSLHPSTYCRTGPRLVNKPE